MAWTHLDPVGMTESGLGGLAGYDPLGSYAPLPPAPPQGQSGQSYGVFAPNYNWSPSSFTNANNVVTGCKMDGAPADCNSVLRAINSGQASRATISTTGGADSLFAAGLGGVTTNLVSGYIHPRLGIIIPKPGVKLTFDRDGSLWRAATFLVPGSQLGGPGVDGATGPRGPQNPSTLIHELGHIQQTRNPNCIMYAVANSTGLARPFGNINNNPASAGYGSIGHDGVHVLASSGSLVKTLPVLTGKVIDIHDGGDNTKIVDVLLDNGNIAIYKDLIPGTVRVGPNQRLSAGSVIGRVGAGTDYAGLHFSIPRGGMTEHDDYRKLTRRVARGDDSARNEIKAGMFINPLGPNSPVNCPGVSVNNAGVVPAP